MEKVCNNLGWVWLKGLIHLAACVFEWHNGMVERWSFWNPKLYRFCGNQHCLNVDIDYWYAIYTYDYTSHMSQVLSRKVFRNQWPFQDLWLNWLGYIQVWLRNWIYCVPSQIGPCQICFTQSSGHLPRAHDHLPRQPTEWGEQFLDGVFGSAYSLVGMYNLCDTEFHLLHCRNPFCPHKNDGFI